MMYVESPKTFTRHARTGTERQEYVREFETWCGRWIAGARGESIASLIDCKSCMKAMRKDGWTV